MRRTPHSSCRRRRMNSLTFSPIKSAYPPRCAIKARVNGARAVVLDADSELAELIPERVLQTARQASVAAIVDIPTGQWDAREDSDRAREGFGLLTLEGVLVRRVGYGGRFGAELLAAGDLLRPWEYDGDETIGFETTWRVLAGTRLAVLDLSWSERMAR